ncbi:MAG: hypothetical protein KC619_30990 [Myxococcales bacterium]|nr:hypothetical protein [Myxococcales bacterium]
MLAGCASTPPVVATAPSDGSLDEAEAVGTLGLGLDEVAARHGEGLVGEMENVAYPARDRDGSYALFFVDLEPDPGEATAPADRRVRVVVHYDASGTGRYVAPVDRAGVLVGRRPRCVMMSRVLPCGATAFQAVDAEPTEGGRPMMAWVTGPGAPHIALSDRVDLDRVEICGWVAPTPFHDSECGDLPVLVAERFRVPPPIARYRCGDDWIALGGSCIEMHDGDETRAPAEGPPHVLPELDAAPRRGEAVTCDADGFCRIDGYTPGVLDDFVEGREPPADAAPADVVDGVPACGTGVLVLTLEGQTDLLVEDDIGALEQATPTFVHLGERAEGTQMTLAVVHGRGGVSARLPRRPAEGERLSVTVGERTLLSCRLTAASFGRPTP